MFPYQLIVGVFGNQISLNKVSESHMGGLIQEGLGSG